MKTVLFDSIYNSFVQDTEARIMKLDEIKEELDQLNKSDLEAIILFVKDKMIANKYINVLLDALESRYSHFVCPFCGGTHIIRSGHYPNGLQKYRCYECDRAFNIYKNTFLECSKNDLITWIKYFIAMDEGKSLRECADYADVCLKTSFYVHHGISSKYLNEYFALIAYSCMNKLTDIETGLREIIRCNCNIRWKDYVHKSLSIIMNK